MLNAPLYVTPKEFCSRYSLSLATLYRLISSGKIEACKIGCATRIPVEQADEYFQSLPRLGTQEALKH